jgi:hypothetical protein
MSSEDWYYKVSLVVGTDFENNEDPAFRFRENEKSKMYEFVDICLSNGHEVKIVHTSEEFDRN